MSIEKKCKNCRFWEDSDVAQKPCKECKCPKFVYTGEGEKVPYDGLGHHDSESYASTVYTGPEFGCIHFKKRFKPGEPISYIYAQPGNDTTWGIVTKVTDEKIHVYDPFFDVNGEIDIESKNYWPTTEEEVKRKVDDELIWDVLRKARKQLGLNPDNNG